MKLHKVSDLEDIFIGKQEPTFAFIDEFCETFGVNKEWLIEGKGSAFRSDRDRKGGPLSNIENIGEVGIDRVLLIRSKSESGEMFIVLKYSDWKYRILTQVLHVSDRVGAGGQLQLVDLYNLINKLRSSGVRCGGRTLEKELFSALLSGKIFPGKVIDLSMSEDPWWDDFTDVEHKLPIAENYNQWHGESFIKAQEIVKWRLKH